jgi:hypothetical protein
LEKMSETLQPREKSNQEIAEQVGRIANRLMSQAEEVHHANAPGTVPQLGISANRVNSKAINGSVETKAEVEKDHLHPEQVDIRIESLELSPDSTTQGSSRIHIRGGQIYGSKVARKTSREGGEPQYARHSMSNGELITESARALQQSNDRVRQAKEVQHTILPSPQPEAVETLQTRSAKAA